MNGIVAMLGVAVLLTATSAGADRGIVNVRVWPVTSIEPSDMLVQVEVEQNPENRLLKVILDSGRFYSSSERPLEGDQAPRTSVFQWRQIPAGDYDIVAQVVGSNGRQRSVARKSVTVLPR